MTKPRMNSESGGPSAPLPSKASRLGSFSALVKIRRKGSVKDTGYPSVSIEVLLVWRAAVHVPRRIARQL